MAFSQLWQKFFWLYIHLKSFDEPFCPRNPDSECRIVADVAGLALFTQIQLVLRLPRHRRIDHNLGNTGNVRIHKSGNGQISYWKIPQIHNSLKLFLTELNQCHSHAFYHVRKYLQKCIPFQFHTSESITHQHTTYKDIDKISPEAQRKQGFISIAKSAVDDKRRSLKS